MLRPRRIHISPHHRQRFSFHYVCAAPAGRRIVRRLQTGIQCHSLQCAHMRHSFFPIQRTAAVAIFVFQLNADDWSSVPAHHSLRLLPDPAVKGLNQFQIRRIIGPHLPCGIPDHPVRKSSVPAFSVRPGTDAQPDLKSGLPAKFEEFSQIPASGKIPLALPFFVMDP